MSFRFLLLAVMCVIAVFAVASEFHNNMEAEFDFDGAFVEVDADAEDHDVSLVDTNTEVDGPYDDMADAWDKIKVPVPAKGPTKPLVIPKAQSHPPKFQKGMPKWLETQNTYEVPTMVDEPSNAEPTYV